MLSRIALAAALPAILAGLLLAVPPPSGGSFVVGGYLLYQAAPVLSAFGLAALAVAGGTTPMRVPARVPASISTMSARALVGRVHSCRRANSRIIPRGESMKPK